MTVKIIPFACSLSLVLASSLVPSADAFVPATLARSKSSSLNVNFVSDMILSKEQADAKVLNVFETETPESVGMKGVGIQSTNPATTPKRRSNRTRSKRKHNYAQQNRFLKEVPDLDFYTLHSSAVDHLYKDMPINDILRAIKRAQNLHDVHDLATIATFLTDECDEHWGYGFRGSLLSRLAVAALHVKEFDVAMQVIQCRRVHERSSMQPLESAAIVRGLMRIHKRQEAWEVLEDELRLPMDGTYDSDIIEQRALVLMSIATRHFYDGQPEVSEKALAMLGKLGVYNLRFEMPWERLMAAATACNEKTKKSSDLTELVWGAMTRFNCPEE